MSRATIELLMLCATSTSTWISLKAQLRTAHINQNITIMTTDKIRNEIGEILWNFWKNQHDIKQIKKAEETLRGELDNKILTDYKYFCEYQLICNKLGINNKFAP